jgi:glycosyltransferase involved in cell wall biosynthesis
MAIRILVVGNFLECSGWSIQCQNLILALDTIKDVEVVPRNINILNNRSQDIPERIKELMGRSDRNPDIIIQNVLPSMLEYTSRVKKNIVYAVSESSNFKATGWQYKINLMNEMWCPCYYNKQAAITSGVTKPIYIVPEATNLEKYNKKYPTHNIRKTYPDNFIFLVLGEWSTRKNIELIIKSFALEFEPTEPVQLFIKCGPVNFNINDRLSKTKEELGLYKDIRRYKKENIQADYVSEEEIYSIHQSTDCLVCGSHAEAWNISSIDSMGFGKPIIVPNYGGFLEYANDKNSFLINGVEDHIQTGGEDKGLPDIYTGGEQWFYPSLKSLMFCMRECYSKENLRRKKIQQAKEDIKKFSFESVGQIIKKALAE